MSGLIFQALEKMANSFAPTFKNPHTLQKPWSFQTPWHMKQHDKQQVYLAEGCDFNLGTINSGMGKNVREASLTQIKKIKHPLKMACNVGNVVFKPDDMNLFPGEHPEPVCQKDCIQTLFQTYLWDKNQKEKRVNNCNFVNKSKQMVSSHRTENKKNENIFFPGTVEDKSHSWVQKLS